MKITLIIMNNLCRILQVIIIVVMILIQVPGKILITLTLILTILILINTTQTIVIIINQLKEVIQVIIFKIFIILTQIVAATLNLNRQLVVTTGLMSHLKTIHINPIKINPHIL